MPARFSLLRLLLPAGAFFGGFLWDAFTIGRSVHASDLWILSAYLVAAGTILWWLGYRNTRTVQAEPPSSQPGRLERLPYLFLQFLFGGLFSALFIFYIKSASHALALVYSLLLGLLLVANEFIHDKYRKFTLTWALFGLCSILLLNFVMPFMVGSISAAWFYISTVVGLCATIALRHLTPTRPGRIGPVWAIAGVLLLAFSLDAIPPVPLVKRDISMGVALARQGEQYLLTYEKKPWTRFWDLSYDDLHLPADKRIYCVSTVFAPSGISTKLYHHWQNYDPQHGWSGKERIGFELAGGRDGGFRGSTYKQNLWPGKWRVSVETERGRTVAVHRFDILPGEVDTDRLQVKRVQ